MSKTQPGKFALINLTAAGVFVFKFFPQRVSTVRHANWAQQDVTIGTKPIYYSNRDPKKITLEELWLDNSGTTGESIAPDIAGLFALLDETDNGSPPKLLANWGDRQEQVVLENVTIEEQFFAPAGFPLRAKVSLELLEVQS